MKARAIPVETLPSDTVGEALSYIAENLRLADAVEIAATVDMGPAEALQAALGVSTRAWLGVDRTGLPVAILGVAPSGVPEVGMPWMVGTSELETEWMALARMTPGIVGQMHDLYPVLTNHVDLRNGLAQDWLLWAGFKFIDADPRFGPEQRPFIQFSRTR